MSDQPDLASIRASLLDWFHHQQRDLPWRETKDPYAIWMSEIMLQQTRVETVKPYFRKFLERFPTVQDMAAADVSEVLALWSGLGYYRRARNLHKASQMVVEVFGGDFPRTHEEVLSLPGVGRYTAGAITSIAYDLPYAAVDGNVHRVMSRLFCIEEARGSKELDKESWYWAEQLVQGEQAGDFNQSLMELGAMICTPRSPTCMLCPIREHCEAYATGRSAELPLPKESKKVKELDVLWAVLRRSGKLLLIKRPDQGLFAGMWELPGLYLDKESETPVETLAAHIAQMGLTVTLQQTPTPYTHVLTHRKLNISLYQGRGVKGKLSLPRTEWQWISLAQLPELGLSSITKTILDQLREEVS